jgi:hypothetical protein
MDGGKRGGLGRQQDSMNCNDGPAILDRRRSLWNHSWLLILGISFGTAQIRGGEVPRDVDEFEKIARLRAGASVIDITPTRLPVIVNGMFEERTADRVHDPLYVRSLVLDDGKTRLAIAVVDSLMLPREYLDSVKIRVAASTTIPVDHVLISATHTHSAPSVMGALGSRPDPHYPDFLAERLVRGIEQAAAALEPAQVGYAVGQDWDHTNCRRWIYRPDRLLTDPFGQLTVRANMHPGYQNPNAIGPSGPVDPDITIVAVRSPSSRVIAVLANYSMHYFGSLPISADYFGRFADRLAHRIVRTGEKPPVVIMSQGTSGDQHWMDYSRPQAAISLDAYSQAVAERAYAVYRKITHYDDAISLAMKETSLRLRRRTPNGARLDWARAIAQRISGRAPRGLAEVYALEAIHLNQEPEREVKIQAIRIGNVGIAALPNEVFAITGLKIKAYSPLLPTLNVSLANGAEGYIPPPEQHALGGYTTWPARTAGLEVEAEPKIVEALLTLLEAVSGKKRRAPTDLSPYANHVLGSRPAAYWRLSEFGGSAAWDTSGHARHAGYEQCGAAFYLDGPVSAALGSRGENRAVHFAGGRLHARIPGFTTPYTVSLWFWNGLPNDARPVTGYLFSRTAGSKRISAGDFLGIAGTGTAPGRLCYDTGASNDRRIYGSTVIEPKTWHHLVMVRGHQGFELYLDGKDAPDLRGAAAVVDSTETADFFFAAADSRPDTFEGRLDEIVVFDRALTRAEIAANHQAAAFSPRNH